MMIVYVYIIYIRMQLECSVHNCKVNQSKIDKDKRE